MKKTKNNIEQQINAVPKSVFREFKSSRKVVVLFSALTWFIILWGLFTTDVSNSTLKEISTFSINAILVIGALGIAIFAVPVGEENMNSKVNRDKVIIRYIGELISQLSIAIFGYMISVFQFGLPSWGVKGACGAMAGIVIFLITHTTASVVAYFNIRE